MFPSPAERVKKEANCTPVLARGIPLLLKGQNFHDSGEMAHQSLPTVLCPLQRWAGDAWPMPAPALLQ